MPEISIIVPVYKVEKYLDRCVTSILNQTFTDFELILVDDGSPDKCPEMCDEWVKKDGRIRVIHKENGGLSSARNAGLEVACGNYIGFVDSDDWILKDMYEELYKLILSGDYDIAVCGIKRCAEADGILKEEYDGVGHITEYSQKDFLKKILKVRTQNSNHYAWNKLYKKNVMENVRYPEGLIDEDVEGTFLAILNSTKIIETSKIGYIYWVNPDSITTATFSEKQFDYLEICNRICEITEKQCENDIKNYAELFRYRADFGMLCKMAISDKEDTKLFQREKNVLVQNLKKHSKELLYSYLPLSRKCLIICMCINSTLTINVLHFFSQIMKPKIMLRY